MVNIDDEDIYKDDIVHNDTQRDVLTLVERKMG